MAPRSASANICFMKLKSIHIAVVLFGFCFIYYTYFPGLMDFDSASQLHQASTFHFDDWHPPIMAFIWSGINKIVPGPAGFFFLQISLYWVTFLLIGLRLILDMKQTRLSYYRYLAFVILPFAPFLINVCGNIWKDVLVFGCFGTALGLILLRPQGYGLWSWQSALIWVLLIVGCLARHNSIAGAVPLLVLHLWPIVPDPRPIRTLLGRGVLAAALTIGTVSTVGYSLDAFVLHAEKTHPINSIFLFDLVGISHHIDRNLVPGRWSPDETNEILTTCYTPMQWDSVAIQGHCHFVWDGLVKSGEWGKGLFPLWFAAVTKYPVAYAAHRLDYMHTLLWPQVTFDHNPKESLEFGFQENFSYRAIKKMVVFIRYQFPLYFVLTDGFWMAVSTILAIGVFWRYRKWPTEYYTPLLVALSAMFSAVPLMVVGPSGDYRYVYWTAGAACIAALLTPGQPERQRAVK
jgi:hypothetical protein